MKLMIVESPNKIRKIKAILGAGWEVAASVGHIRDLPVKDLGLGMPGYVPEYELSERGADVVKRLRGMAAKAKEGVYLATDPDREGEAIAWHVSEALKLKGARRVTFDSITPEVVRRALERTRAVDMHLVHAQEARRVLDRLVGYQVSPLLGRGLSAGRVQSPAVRLVVEREREIAAFVEVRHFGAELLFGVKPDAWRAQWEPALPKGEKYCLDEELAKRAAASRECVVTESGNKKVMQAPPPPFTTSTMLQAASVRLRWKPDVTAGVAQKLFEAGLITYHRTDSVNFSAEALREVRAYAEGRGLPLPGAARKFKSKGGAQEAHEAVRPTHFEDEHAGEDPSQQALYRLIWERAVASQLADAEWSVNTTRLRAAAGSAAFLFRAEGRVLVAPGWRGLTGRDAAEEDEEAQGDGRVPVLVVGKAVTARDGRVLYKKTEPPTRYTQATLIKRLEGLGIGRPSTYPAILKNVQGRGYVDDEGKYLRPTGVGEAVVDGLVGRFGFVEYAFTRDLERDLDRIAEGQAEYLPVVRAADERLREEIGKASGFSAVRSGTTRAAAPKAAARPPARTGAGSDGPEGGTRWALQPGGFLASRLRARPDFLPEEQGASAAAREAREPAPAVRAKAGRKKAAAPAVAAKSGRAKAAVPAKTAKKKPGKGLAAAKAAPARADAQAPVPCPVCKEGVVRLPREDAKAWGCSRWAEAKCPLTIWRSIAGRTTAEAEMRLLCRTGRTKVLSGFQSKAGKTFEAGLRLSEEGKVEFVFEN